MTTDRELDEILAEIGRGHRAVGAPERVEARLFAAAVEQKKARSLARLGHTWKWAAAAVLIAAAAIAGTIWQIRKAPQQVNQQAHFAPAPQTQAQAAPPSMSVAVKPSISAKAARTGWAGTERSGTDRASNHASSQGQTKWGPLDEFVPLPVSEGLAPAADLSVVRIKLRGSDLQQYGLEAPADAAARTMLAEFVVGEDGLPRAIRIVR